MDVKSFIFMLMKERSVFPYPGELVIIFWISVCCLEKKLIVQFLLRDFQKPVVLRPEHADVHVVVPGDEALVADGAKQGAGKKLIVDVVFFADPVKCNHYLQLHQLYFA